MPYLEDVIFESGLHLWDQKFDVGGQEFENGEESAAKTAERLETGHPHCLSVRSFLPSSHHQLLPSLKCFFSNEQNITCRWKQHCSSAKRPNEKQKQKGKHAQERWQ